MKKYILCKGNRIYKIEELYIGRKTFVSSRDFIVHRKKDIIKQSNKLEDLCKNIK